MVPEPVNINIITVILIGKNVTLVSSLTPIDLDPRDQPQI